MNEVAKINQKRINKTYTGACIRMPVPQCGYCYSYLSVGLKNKYWWCGNCGAHWETKGEHPIMKND